MHPPADTTGRDTTPATEGQPSLLSGRRGRPGAGHPARQRAQERVPVAPSGAPQLGSDPGRPEGETW